MRLRPACLAVYMAREYSPRIRVNAIAPGFFLTEQNRNLLTEPESGRLTQRGQSILEHTPMGRFGQPEDLLGTVVWLLSPASAFVVSVDLSWSSGDDDAVYLGEGDAGLVVAGTAPVYANPVGPASWPSAFSASVRNCWSDVLGPSCKNIRPATKTVSVLDTVGLPNGSE